ncbi:MAG TPA: hypothetical protein VIX14_00655 [Terriglobales bacterium]
MRKTAQLAIARGLAETTAGTGVTVNSVLPAPPPPKGVNEFVDRMAVSSNQTREQLETEFFRNIRPSSLLRPLRASRRSGGAGGVRLQPALLCDERRCS